MKTYNIYKMLDALLNYTRLENLSNFAKAHLPFDATVCTSKEPNCYTTTSWSGTTQIVLGLTFYPTVFDIPEDIPNDKLTETWYHAANVYYGLYYHELFHGLYTPMAYITEVFRRMDSNLANFLHPIMNILEDASIEPSGCNRFPKAKQYLDILNKVHTRPEIIETVSRQVKENPRDPQTMISFLLLKARGYEDALTESYSLYEEHKDFFNNCIFNILHTVQGKDRFRKEIAFGKQLIRILDLKMPEQKEVDNPTEDPSSGNGPSMPGNPGGSSEDRKAISKLIEDLNKTSNDPTQWKKPPEVPTKDLDLPEAKTTQKATQENYSESSEPCVSDITDEEVSMLANDEPVLNAVHRAVNLSDYKDTRGYLQEYNKEAIAGLPLINQTTQTIRRMKSHNDTAWETELKSGKFDIKAVLNPKLLEKGQVFKKAIAPSKEADLCTLILVDNSGSMHGKKSRLAGRACIILSEALNRTKYPFGVYAFTEGNECITIKLKDFKEDYNRAKTNLTLFTEQFNVNKIATFSGNVDEVNLKYCRDVLKKQKQKDKICIVISDGATCGSWKDLKKIAHSMEQQGITVLGIGIYDDNVKDIYTNHIIIKNEGDLNKLPTFLTNYLVNKILIKEDE